MVNLSDPSNERIHRRCSVLSLLIIKIASLSTYVLLSLSDFKTEVAKMMSAVSFSRIVHIYLSRPRLLILPMVSECSTVSPKEIFNVAMFRFLSVPNYVEPLSMFSSSLNIQKMPSTELCYVFSLSQRNGRRLSRRSNNIFIDRCLWLSSARDEYEYRRISSRQRAFLQYFICPRILNT
jgi:hypothetical protein